MDHYHHLSIRERESIRFMRGEGKRIRTIAAALGRAASMINRELKRNKTENENLPSQAVRKYRSRRKSCCPKSVLADSAAKAIIKRLFLEEQWSPEQTANRLKEEKTLFANYVIAGKHAIRKEETRGKLRISNPIEE